MAGKKIQLNPYEMEWMLKYVAQENIESYIKTCFEPSRVAQSCYPPIPLLEKITPEIYELIKSKNCSLPKYEKMVAGKEALKVLHEMGD